MSRLTPSLAVKHVNYVNREEAAGRLTPNLAAIREHRLALLRRSKCCVRCGRKIENRESLKAWQADGYGPECRATVERVAS